MSTNAAYLGSTPALAGGEGAQLGGAHDQVGVDPVVGDGFGFDGFPGVPIEQPAFMGVGEHGADDSAGAPDAARRELSGISSEVVVADAFDEVVQLDVGDVG